MYQQVPVRQHPAWSRQAYRSAYRSPAQLGQVGMATPSERSNLTSLTMAIALAGGGAWALTSIPTAPTKTAKVAMGVLGGGLLLTGALKGWEAFS